MGFRVCGTMGSKKGPGDVVGRFLFVTDVVFTDSKVEQTSSEADSELSSHSIPYHTG